MKRSYKVAAFIAFYAVLTYFAWAKPEAPKKHYPANSIPDKEGVTYQLDTDKLAQLSKLANRATIEERKIEGDKVIETWSERGHRWSVTNAIVPVVSVKLENTFRERIEALETARSQLANAVTNETLRAERAERRFYNATNNLQKAINDAKLSTTRILLQGIMDKIIEIDDKLN